MKRLNKILILILALTLAMSAMCISAFAAGSASTKAGESGSVTFTFNNVTSVDGEFSPEAGITITSITHNAAFGDATTSKVYVWSTSKTNISVTVKYTVASTATVGSKLEIAFEGKVGDSTGNNLPVPASDTAEITVAAATTPTPSNPPSVNYVDTAELKAQIAIAEALNEADYTKATWDAMAKELADAKGFLTSANQASVDKAAQDLKAAIAALVKIDRTALIEALGKAESTIDKNEDGKIWGALIDAIVAGNALLESRTQADIDAGVTALLNALKAVEELLNKAPGTIIEKVEVPVEVIVEVPVEVPGEKEMPVVWLVILIISAVINVAFIVLAVLYFIKKKNNHKDNTPLVDYNIEDDDN